MDVEIFAICEYADNMANNRLLIVGTFDGIYSPSVPFSHVFHVAFRVRIPRHNYGQVAIGLKLIDPDGAVMIDIKGDGHLQPDGVFDDFAFCHVFRFTPWEFKSFGKHSLVLSINGQDVRRLPLNILKQPSA